MLEESKVQELKTSIRGQLLRPEDGEYEGARKVFNAMIDRRPALIARCAGAADVIDPAHEDPIARAQAIDASTDPVVATHHGLRSVNNIPRNMPDSLLKKMAAKGGVIGFQIGNEFHNRKVFDWRTQHAGKPFWDTTAIGRAATAPGPASRCGSRGFSRR